MRFPEHRGCPLLAAVICLLVSGISFGSGDEAPAAAKKAWEDLGRQLLFRLGTARSSSAEWIQCELEAVDPCSPRALSVAEALVLNALDAYGDAVIVEQGRIPLNAHPRCILGLYVQSRFAGTRLGDWGRAQFQRCVEQTCVAVLPIVGGHWRTSLEARLLSDTASDQPSLENGFHAAELPYLYWHLVENASSADARTKARERLARCLSQECGLEPGLRQYLLLERGSRTNIAWLGETARLDQIGSHPAVKRLHERWIVEAESAEQARESCEQLVGILLRESRYRQALVALDQVSRRFGQVRWATPEIRDFLAEFQENRTQTRRRLAEMVAQSPGELQALRYCRRLDALWMQQQAPLAWRELIKEWMPGSLASQYGRVFLAKALLELSQAEPAEEVVRTLAESTSPLVQAQHLALSAQIARAKGQWKESVRLYTQALQIDRPTSAPPWCKSLVAGLPLDVEASPEELQIRGLFLKGCQDLMDTDYAAAVDDLSLAAADWKRLPPPLRRATSSAMMAACLGAEDYMETEIWGHRVLEQYRDDHPQDGATPSLLARIEHLDAALAHLVASVRRQTSDSSASPVLEQAVQVCNALAHLESCEVLAGEVEAGVQRTYNIARRHRDAQLLVLEHNYVRQQAIGIAPPIRTEDLEPLLFAAQVLAGDTLDLLREDPAAAAQTEETRDRLHRFAAFAMRVNRPDLMRIALDLAAKEPANLVVAREQTAQLGSADLREDLAAAYRANPAAFWRELGMLLLARSGSVSTPATDWFDRVLEGVDPNSEAAVIRAQSFLMRVVDGYGQDAMAVEGRIRLDSNPACILGLYMAYRFPGTRLADWGRRQFARSVEQACSVAMPTAGTPWRETMESGLLAPQGEPLQSLQLGAFSQTELLYLYLFWAQEAKPIDAQHQARRRLAARLGEDYGLEARLRQYLVLLNRNCRIDDAGLEVAGWLDQMGFRRAAKGLYGQLLENSDTVRQGPAAAEGLVRILLTESRLREARSVLDTLSERFPGVEPNATDIRDFAREWRLDRDQTARRLMGELISATKDLQILNLCRSFDALWTPEEAPQRWQTLIRGTDMGSLAEQFGRVFCAKALLRTGKIDESQTAVRGLTESANPLLRRQSLMLLAEAALARGSMAESANLCIEAAGIDRPMSLPDWFRDLMRPSSPASQTPQPELPARVRFFRACNDLADGDFASAEDGLASLAADSAALPVSVRRALPSAMALTYWGLGDYGQAKTWGWRALEARQQDDSNNVAIGDFVARIQDMDVTVCHLVADATHDLAGSSEGDAVLERAIRLCDLAADLDGLGSRPKAAKDGMLQLYLQAKKRQMAQALTAEYRWIRQRQAARGPVANPSAFEPLLFCAQIIAGDSADRIQKTFACIPEDGQIRDRMYRFLAFARNTHRPDVVRNVLDAAAAEQMSTTTPEVLEDIAKAYLDVSSHHKAIDIYKILAADMKTPDRAKSARLTLIDLYAERLKNPGQAVLECEEFLRSHPDDPQASQVEFLMGKYAYLNKDYSGAVGCLDAFRKRHHDHPQAGQAMLLAGLCRMTEGNTQEAIGRFTEVIRLYPDDDLAARSKFLIGYAQISEQKYEAALETFKQLIEQFPDCSYAPQAQNLITRLSKVPQ